MKKRGINIYILFGLIIGVLLISVFVYLYKTDLSLSPKSPVSKGGLRTTIKVRPLEGSPCTDNSQCAGNPCPPSQCQKDLFECRNNVCTNTGTKVSCNNAGTVCNWGDGVCYNSNGDVPAVGDSCAAGSRNVMLCDSTGGCVVPGIKLCNNAACGSGRYCPNAGQSCSGVTAIDYKCNADFVCEGYDTYSSCENGDDCMYKTGHLSCNSCIAGQCAGNPQPCG